MKKILLLLLIILPLLGFSQKGPGIGITLDPGGTTVSVQDTLNEASPWRIISSPEVPLAQAEGTIIDAVEYRLVRAEQALARYHTWIKEAFDAYGAINGPYNTIFGKNLIRTLNVRDTLQSVNILGNYTVTLENNTTFNATMTLGVNEQYQLDDGQGGTWVVSSVLGGAFMRLVAFDAGRGPITYVLSRDPFNTNRYIAEDHYTTNSNFSLLKL